MKFSYNWLQNHFEKKLPEVNVLAKKIGIHSFELEEIEKVEFNGKKDFLIDWDVLPNRSSDCLCYMGMAKEIGAVLNMPSKDFAIDFSEEKYSNEIKTSDFISLEVKNKDFVKRALKRIAFDVKITESPEWMKEFLHSIGQKSINNVVDITNYVMWTTGQPVHAFDYDKLAGKEDFKNIKIDFAKNGEKIIDLSGTEHKIDNTMLVISDGKKTLDIAGIKGGNNSGVDENTTRLILSAVNFEFENIRNTSKKLKLKTDASKRFENEVPINKVFLAMNQMSFLLKEFANAKVSKEVIDTNPNYFVSKKISCSTDKINSLLGLKLTEDQISKIFSSLDFKHEVDSGIFIVEPAEERLDINIWQDLAEEAGRIYGYQSIEESFPEESFYLPKKNKIKDSANKICDFLVDEGFYEMYNRSLVSNGKVFLENSLNSKAQALRENLLENLNKRIKKNTIHSDEPKLFEIGRVFKKLENKKEDRVVNENLSFAGIIGKKKIKEKNKEEVFLITKGYLEKIFEKISIKDVSWQKSDENDFVAEIFCMKESIGKVGINFWEIDLEKLVEKINTKVFYKKVSKYPKIDRDVAFFVPKNCTVDNARSLIKSILPDEAKELKVFDIYQDKEKQQKSFAFKIIFQSDEKTLSDEYANREMDKVYKVLKKNNFEIR